ncbi:MAG TPA: FUSC family protein [Acidimicrobiales bacterium]|jgi:hypothetical protein|nr:FUSC family protein [Acidimicrobiales bacterium]
MNSFALRSTLATRFSGAARLPVGRELQRAFVTMGATLGAFASALVVERLARQNLTFVILAVVLALSLSRTQRAPGWRHRLGDLAVVPLVALAAGAVGQLFFQHPNYGAVAFVAAQAGAMWLRQFGRTVARVAQLVTLPITSILVVPGVGIGGGPHARWWQIVAALLALGWVVAVQSLARRLGALPSPPKDRPQSAPPVQPARSVRSLSGHTRMALQLAVALTAAFIIGRTAFPMHWNWVVLTATIVCSSGPGRGHVLFKGIARLVGAATGTVVATVLSAHLPGHQDGTIVVIFVLLFSGSWGRELHYALWAGCVTCVAALLNGYLGLPGVSVLGTRLLAILVGAACATVVCFLVVPMPTQSMVRRQRAFALQALTHLTLGLAQGADDLLERHRAFAATVRELHRSVRPLHWQRALFGRLLPPDPLLMDSVDGALACARPTRQLIVDLSAAPYWRADGTLRRSAGVVTRNLGLMRKELAGARDEGSGPLVATVEDVRLEPLNSTVVAIVPPSASRLAVVDELL